MFLNHKLSKLGPALDLGVFKPCRGMVQTLFAIKVKRHKETASPDHKQNNQINAFLAADEVIDQKQKTSRDQPAGR
jgi:hypothetical protein